MKATNLVDVVISVYGKPYQTAVTLKSLLKHSGQWIDKIYFVEEYKQPHGESFEFIKAHLGSRLVYYRPKVWWFYRNQLEWRYLFTLPVFRHSIRYQYGWEKSDKDFLLLIHNDMYISGDIVGSYLDQIGGHIGIGKIGQCWNCSAYKAQKCEGAQYLKFRPDQNERDELFAKYPPLEARALIHQAFCNQKEPSWPLPECRLNEFITLINLKMARPLVWPYGQARPIGLFQFETGVQWFRDMLARGYYPKHMDYEGMATHGWASSQGSGHGALFNGDIYQEEEERARQVLSSEFGMEIPDSYLSAGLRK
ncbi:hypothetical protein [Dyadobacter tibetensis]|uniref:hypothetical protein n=1 Tax=Dyadobacter tibetensis TaxID=1211851 RepID=UPI000472CE8A|nr:hypothetical protein [Dyadobacter tibetensis]